MKSIISFLTFIVEGLARAVVFLLSSLGLWIPALFSLLFLIVCAITKTPFSEVSGMFFVGLTLSLLLSISIAVAQVLKQRDKKRLEKNGIAPKSLKKKKTERVEKRRGDEENQEFTQINTVQSPSQSGGSPAQFRPDYGSRGYGTSPAQNYGGPSDYGSRGYGASPAQNYGGPSDYGSRGYGTPPAQNYGGPSDYGSRGYGAPPVQNYGALPDYGSRPNGNAQYENTSNGGFEDKRSESMYEQAKRSLYTEFSGYNASGSDRGGVYGNAGGELKETQEKPVGVFRTRSDPRMLIYEYSDRYDYWRKNDNGKLEYLRTETKRS